MRSIRPALKSALILSAVAAGLAAYLSQNPIPGFLFKLNAVVITVLFLISAGALGQRALAALKLTRLSPLEHLIFSLVSGLGLWSLLAVLLGLFRAWTPWKVWIFVMLAVTLSRPFLRIFAEWIDALRRMSLSALAFAGFLITGGISFLLALTPITYYDSLVYHLALPAAYIQAHHWIGLPGMIYSAFPQMLEMLWTIGLLIGNSLVVNLIAWTLSVLLVLSLAAFGGRFFDRPTGQLAAILLALMPAVLLLSSGGYVEIGLTLYSFLALYAVFLFIETERGGFLLLAGALAGWTVGIKYTGVIPALLSALFLLTMAREKRVRAAGVYLGTAFLTFLPWLIKNWIFVGNPVFPFFAQWGVAARNPWLHQAASGYFQMLTEYQPRNFLQLLLLIRDIPLHALGFGGGADVLGDLGWAPFIWFLPALWLCGPLPKIVKALAMYAICFIIPWGMSRPVLRFLLPVLPALALLTAYAWTNGMERQPPVMRGIGRAFLGTFILSGLFLFGWVTQITEPFAVAIGLESSDHYLMRKLNYYSAAKFVNEATPPESSVLLVGDQRGFYYWRPLAVSPVFSRSPLVDWADESSDGRALALRLKNAGFTHLVVNRVEMQRLSGYSILPFSKKGAKNWDALQKETPRVYADAACDVFEL